MHKALLSLCLCLLAWSSAHAVASEPDSPIPLRVLVQLPIRSFDSSPGFDQVGAALTASPISSERVEARPLISWTPRNPQRLRELGLDRYYRVTPAPGWGWAEALADLPAGTLVLGVDPVGQLHADEEKPGHTAEYPNDPLFPEQVGLLAPPTGVGILSAWKETYGSPDVVIAVVDSGVSKSHRDLIRQLVTGYNALDGSSSTDDGTASHGTHIAGIAAASTNNGLGIAGVCRGAKIMPVKSFFSSGFGLETDIAEGIIWAADHGADVISMSFGFQAILGPMQLAVQYAYEEGCVLVASTGNVPGQAIGYPAKFSSVIAVGALATSGSLWSNSSTGPEVTVVAPGYCILSTWDTPTEPNTYKQQTGTSMAVPFVAGLAGLIRTITPSLTVDEVQWVIRDTAVDLGTPGVDNQYGAGRIDPAMAIHAAYVLAATTCRVDFTGDGVRDSADIAAFVEAYLAGEPSADLAIPFGVLDTQDIERFLDLYFSGCGSM